VGRLGVASVRWFRATSAAPCRDQGAARGMGAPAAGDFPRAHTSEWRLRGVVAGEYSPRAPAIHPLRMASPRTLALALSPWQGDRLRQRQGENSQAASVNTSLAAACQRACGGRRGGGEGFVRDCRHRHRRHVLVQLLCQLLALRRSAFGPGRALTPMCRGFGRCLLRAQGRG
jgi:hypothetical protein